MMFMFGPLTNAQGRHRLSAHERRVLMGRTANGDTTFIAGAVFDVFQ